ncbi:RIP metalloprotease RseP [Patescibacteria group bacterium]|nr:RIP metalloprotease RseP [Patescibacteria group bacterium]
MFTTLLLFIIILGLLVFVHEFGHFFAAKKLGAKVDEFGFGFPPRMVGVYRVGKKWKWTFRKTPKIKQTIYSLNWIPLGGFVKIKGEEGTEKDEPDSFASKSIGKRAIILVAGVTMNVILAMVILSIGFGIGIPQAIGDKMSPRAIIKDRNIQIVSVLKDSMADKAGIESGDEVLALDGRKVNFKEMQDYLTGKVGEKVTYTIKRDDETIEKKIVPSILEETGKGGIGVGLVEIGVVSYPWYLAIWKGIMEAFFYIKEIAIAFGTLFKNLFVGKGVSVDLSGPVGIAVITGKVARMGLIYLMQFTAILSVNLAIINVFPFPALDGGRLLFLAIEKIRNKPVSQRIESTIHNLGFALLMILIVTITARDFMKFGDKFLNLWQSIIQ